MRTIRAIAAIVVAVGLWPAAGPAAPLDGSAPILCALNSVIECSRQGECERSSAEAAHVPPFVRVNVQQRLLSSADGTRTSPIVGFQRSNGRLMLQGMQNDRVWGAVIDEQSGHLSAAIGEAEGALVILGSCIVP